MTLTLILSSIPNTFISIIICFVETKKIATFWGHFCHCSSQMEVKKKKLFTLLWMKLFHVHHLHYTHCNPQRSFHSVFSPFLLALWTSWKNLFILNFLYILVTPFGSRPVIKFHFMYFFLARNGERNDFFFLHFCVLMSVKFSILNCWSIWFAFCSVHTNFTLIFYLVSFWHYYEL